MDVKKITQILEAYKAGELTQEDVVHFIKNMPYEDLGYAKVDHHRALRNGFPEVIFGLGKTPEQIAEIFARLAENNDSVLATKVDGSAYQAVKKVCPEASFHELARLIVLEKKPDRPKRGQILVVSAGTADLPVAEEAAISAQVMGNQVTRLYDVGVAGVHRLLANYHYFAQAQVIIVVAGMEGALASVVGGLVEQPVIAVPTSVGYGANFQGVAPLLSMLNSCAAGVSVVNIDNGFGAAAVANAVQLMIEKALLQQGKG